MMQAAATKVCWEVALASFATGFVRSRLSFSSSVVRRNPAGVSDELWASLAVRRYGVKRRRRSDKSVDK